MSDPVSGWRKVVARIPLNRGERGLLLAILVVVLLTLVFDQQHSYLHDPSASAIDILRHTAMLGIFALGSALVIIAGGIDLSSGAVVAFSGTICATFMVLLGPTGTLDVSNVSAVVMCTAIFGTLVVGFLIGSLHAWLITVVGLPPFVATLATLVGLRSLARAITPHVSHSTQIQIFDDSFRYLATSIWIPVVVFVVLAIVVWLLLSRTVVGRHLYALGGNEQATRLSGIHTERLKWLAYSISAMLASVAGILYIGDQSVAAPQTLGMGYELNAIAAAVVGGCSLRGGAGTIPGTVLGCLFLRVVIDGIAKVIDVGSDLYEGTIVGIVVVVAVAVNQMRKGGERRTAMFPGPLGAVSILNLSLLAGVLGLLLFGHQYGIGVALVTLGVLGTLTIMSALGSRRANARTRNP